MSHVLLQTKLYHPRPRPALVPRPRLSEQLNAGLNGKLTLVTAPAGFGKTTLVSEWLHHPQFTVHDYCWLSLDEDDNDLVRFLAYLIAALQTAVSSIGETAARLLQSAQPPAAEAILTLLINDISRNDQPLILVLDDYHVIETTAIHRALTFLLDHLPPQLHLLITTRSDPALPLSRLRGRGQMVEIRANDLRFTLDEVQLFLNQVMGLALSKEEMAALEQRTEGWIAGLQLAAIAIQSSLSMPGRDDLPNFIAAFTGSHRFVLDYLTDEVLEQRPKGTRDFLLQTSILNRLCGPLCDAVTGQTESQSHALLQRLEHANLFLIPLDEKRHWYRYHPLFAEVLQARLWQDQGDRVAELFRRAAGWHISQGMIDEAIYYALAGADFEQAAQLIEQVAGNMLRKGSSATLTRWLDTMPEAVVRTRPRLCLTRSWTYVMGLVIRPENAAEWVQLAKQAAAADQSLDDSLTGEMAALQAMIASIWNEVMDSIEYSRQALDSLPADSPWRSVITFCLGSVLFLSGDIAGATHFLGDALRLSQEDGSHYIQLNAASFLGDLEVFRGQLSRAAEIYEQVLVSADHGIPQKGALMAHGGLAHILYERNQLAAALTHIELGIEQLEQVGGSWSSLMLYRTLGRIQQALGNWIEALEALDRAYQSGQRTQVSIVVTQSAALRARLQLIQEDIEAAERWAANSGLSVDDPKADHPGLREEEYLSLARVLNAQGRHTEAQSLLHRLLHSAEAEGRIGSVIIILVLQCLSLQAQGHTAHALTVLERALKLAAPEGYVRLFLDEGEPLRQLLAILAARPAVKPSLHHYAEQLLADFARPVRARWPDEVVPGTSKAFPGRLTPTDLPEPLTSRELEILRLIADGRTNPEIAATLFLAVGTVKKHTNNLFGKLSASNRTQAVKRGRDLGLL